MEDLSIMARLYHEHRDRNNFDSDEVNQAQKALGNYLDTRSEIQSFDVKDSILSLSSEWAVESEKQGFAIGFRYAFRIFTECIEKERDVI